MSESDLAAAREETQSERRCRVANDLPDYEAPVVRNAPDGMRELAMLRWGMPTPKNFLIEATKRCAARGILAFPQNDLSK